VVATVTAQLKETFFTTGVKIEKIQFLWFLPKSWSVRKIQQEFNTSGYMAWA
jgi:hypothetical protein